MYPQPIHPETASHAERRLCTEFERQLPDGSSRSIPSRGRRVTRRLVCAVVIASRDLPEDVKRRLGSIW